MFMNKNMNRYLSATRTVFQVLSYLSFLLAAVALSFPTHYINIFLFTWMVFNGADLLLRGKYNFELPNKNNIHLYFLLAFYLWMVISLFWTSDLGEGQKILMKRISFLIFPLFAFFGVNRLYNLKQILLAFLLGTILSTLAFIAFCYVNYTKNPEWFSNLNQLGQYTISIYKHRTYFDICLVLGVISYIYLKDFIIKRTSSIFYYITFLLLIVLYWEVVYFTGGRMSLIIFFIILILTGFKFLWEKGYYKLIVLFLLTALFSSVIVLKNHSRMQHLELTQEKLQQFDPRYELWRNTIQCIQNSNILSGTGVGDCENVFVENHQKPEFRKYYYETESPHNEFLKTQLELGIVGTLLLIAILISVVVNNKSKNARFFTLNIGVVWFLFLLIETIGITSTSTYMFAFCLLLVYWAKDKAALEKV